MRLLIVPDLHLQGSLLLPRIEAVIKSTNTPIDKWVFLGDYFDQWQVQDIKIPTKETQYLEQFAATHECIFLIGNHDIPYITTNIEHYSHPSPTVAMMYQQTLANLQCQLAYEEGDWLFSHAGLVTGKLNEMDTHIINNTTISTNDELLYYLSNIQSESGWTSGGLAPVPSLVWARPDDWYHATNPNYKYQVVGHTPQTEITDITDEHGTVYFTDTMSLSYNYLSKRYSAYGNHTCLYVDTETNDILVIQPDRQNINEHINNHFGRRKDSIHELL